MSSRVQVSDYLRSNVLGLVAIFIALGGTSYAVKSNSVGPKQIKKGAVRAKHVKSKAIKAKHVKPKAVATKHVQPNAITGGLVQDDSLTGDDIDEATLKGLDGGGASGPAGGDLTGSYPNPSIAPNAVASGNVGADALGGADIDESSLGKVPDADTLDGSDSTDFLGTGDTAGGDLGGPFSNLQVQANALGGDDIDESSLGQVPNADTLDGTDSSDFLGTSDNAGGDLGGPFSNLQVQANAVGSSEIANGSVTADDLASEETTVYVPGNAFVPNYLEFTSYDPPASTSAGYLYITGGAATYQNYLSAPVQLPPGATVTGLTCRHYDNSGTAGTSGDAWLYRRTVAATSSNTMGSLAMDTTVGDTDTAILTETDSSINYSLVGEDIYYFLRVHWNTGANASPNVRFYGCEVEYDS